MLYNTEDMIQQKIWLSEGSLSLFYIWILSLRPVGGLQVPGGSGWDPGGRLLCPLLHGLLLLDRRPLLAHHPAGRAFPGARRWSRQHLHLCAGVPGVYLFVYTCIADFTGCEL